MNIEEYSFKTEPYQHQIDTLKLSANENLYPLILEMGLGKSKILLDNIAILFKEKKISGAVIVAPKGVLDNWGRNEIDKHLPDDIKKEVLIWQPNHTQRWTKDFKRMVEEDSTGKLNIFLINV